MNRRELMKGALGAALLPVIPGKIVTVMSDDVVPILRQPAMYVPPSSILEGNNGGCKWLMTLKKMDGSGYECVAFPSAWNIDIDQQVVTTDHGLIGVDWDRAIESTINVTFKVIGSVRALSC